MKKDNKFFDDLTKVADSTVATMINMKRDFSQFIKEQMQLGIQKMDLVTRAEFEVLRKVTLDTRKELEQIKARGNKMKKKTAKKSAAKKPAAKKSASKSKKK